MDAGDAAIPMRVLFCDVNANKTVSNADVVLVKAEVGASFTSSNFRNDVKAGGTVNNTDVAATKAQVAVKLTTNKLTIAFSHL